MKNRIVIILIVFLGLFLSCEKEKAVFFPPELGEFKITEITDSSAMISCNIEETNKMNVQECGFCYYLKEDSSIVNYVKTSSQNEFSATISSLLSGKEYMVKAYAKNVVGVSYSYIISFKTTHQTIGTANGHDWVDLGLPSGTKWATCNVGATTPEGYGNYFAWGETTPKITYNWSTYRYCNGSYRKLTKYCNNSNYGNNGFTDALITLEASDDAATANWGGGWRMPTETEMIELLNRCTHEWTIQNGVDGEKFTGPNGNSIFLPSAGYRDSDGLHSDVTSGYYWSSSLDSGDTSRALGIRFYSDYRCRNSRFYGQSVRPVCDCR